MPTTPNAKKVPKKRFLVLIILALREVSALNFCAFRINVCCNWSASLILILSLVFVGFEDILFCGLRITTQEGRRIDAIRTMIYVV